VHARIELKVAPRGCSPAVCTLSTGRPLRCQTSPRQQQLQQRLVRRARTAARTAARPVLASAQQSAVQLTEKEASAKQHFLDQVSGGGQPVEQQAIALLTDAARNRKV